MIAAYCLGDGGRHLALARITTQHITGRDTFGVGAAIFILGLCWRALRYGVCLANAACACVFALALRAEAAVPQRMTIAKRPFESRRGPDSPGCLGRLPRSGAMSAPTEHSVALDLSAALRRVRIRSSCNRAMTGLAMQVVGHRYRGAWVGSVRRGMGQLTRGCRIKVYNASAYIGASSLLAGLLFH